MSGRSKGGHGASGSSVRGHALRRRFLLLGILVGAGVVVFRAAQLQVAEGGRWRARAEDQHMDRLVLPAPRGTIYDRNGVPLAASEQSFRVALAPRELQDRRRTISLLMQVLGLSAAEARHATDPARPWVVLPGLHDAVAREVAALAPGEREEVGGPLATRVGDADAALPATPPTSNTVPMAPATAPWPRHFKKNRLLAAAGPWSGMLCSVMEDLLMRIQGLRRRTRSENRFSNLQGFCQR